MKKKLEIGLIGNPCAGSLSPLLHSVLAKACGISLCYHLWETPEEELRPLVLSMAKQDLAGMNVTIPYKGKVLPTLAGASPLARTLGAANTLIKTSKGFYGANTDVYGFVSFLKHRGISLAGRDCLLLGSGGAAKAVAYAMASDGARIFVWSRNEEKQREFLDHMNGLFPGSFAYCGDSELVGRFYSMMVNTIPLAAEYENVLLYDRIRASLWVDINYSVSGTPLEELATERGIAFADGKEMLFYQGLRSFEIWNDRLFEKEEAEALLNEFLSRAKRKIVLVGFMGTGKSTVSCLLEKMAGFERVSTDLKLETDSGMSISRLFAEKGESYFRGLESAALADILAAESPCSVDCGGGIVLREENRTRIGASGALTVWLDCDEAVLLERLRGDRVRPLLAGKSDEEIIALIRGRREYYRQVADFTVDASRDPLITAKEIMKKWSES